MIYKKDGDNIETNIKKARMAAGLSIKETAELFGAPYRTFQNYDNGASSPPTWMEKIILDKLKHVEDGNS